MMTNSFVGLSGTVIPYMPLFPAATASLYEGDLLGVGGPLLGTVAGVPVTMRSDWISSVSAKLSESAFPAAWVNFESPGQAWDYPDIAVNMMALLKSEFPSVEWSLYQDTPYSGLAGFLNPQEVRRRLTATREVRDFTAVRTTNVYMGSFAAYSFEDQLTWIYRCNAFTEWRQIGGPLQVFVSLRNQAFYNQAAALEQYLTAFQLSRYLAALRSFNRFFSSVSLVWWDSFLNDDDVEVLETYLAQSDVQLALLDGGF